MLDIFRQLLKYILDQSSNYPRVRFVDVLRRYIPMPVNGVSWPSSTVKTFLKGVSSFSPLIPFFPLDLDLAFSSLSASSSGSLYSSLNKNCKKIWSILGPQKGYYPLMIHLSFSFLQLPDSRTLTSELYLTCRGNPDHPTSLDLKT